MKTNSVPFLLLAATVSFAAPAAFADAVHAPAANPAVIDSNKAHYNLFNPTPKELMREMSTDRPDTTESPITVDAGHFQIEASFVDFNRDKSQGVKTETWAFGQMNLKAGLFDRTDIQFVFNTHENEKTSAGGSSSTANGISDLTVRLKQNMWGNEGDTKTAFALMPWLKAPTGSGDLSNDKYEGGLIAPLGFEVTEGVAAAVMLQGDVLWDDANSKYFVDWMHTATCGFEITDALGMYVEYVGRHSSGTASNYRAFGDVGVTFAVNDNLILDTGVRVGLNKAADDFGWFAGVSYRY
jgi:hypothetical protein